MNEFDPTSIEHGTTVLDESDLISEEFLEAFDGPFTEQFAPDEEGFEFDPGFESVTTETEELPTEPAEAVAAPPLPRRPPLQLRKRTVSGRYHSAGFTQLDLRVDVDGRRSMKMLSGDFFHRIGATVTYFGSFTVDSPRIYRFHNFVVIDGQIRTSWQAVAPRVRVFIRRVPVLAPPAPAKVVFYRHPRRILARYECRYVSRHFRSVLLEEDFVRYTTPFQKYDTGLLPSGGPARELGVEKAYAEAGLHLRHAGVTNIVPVSQGSLDEPWDNAELHDAMERHFSLYADRPAWRVWLLTAHRHVNPLVRGIMFDQKGRHRQGCAVFQHLMAGSHPTRQRQQLYTSVHELGHCFNLFHSFHKIYMTPPQPNRLDALSWMNYPGNYRSPTGNGEAAFWAAFPFQFDEEELIHLRHAFRNQVIPGGKPFGTGAAFDSLNAFDAPVHDETGLELELAVRPSYFLGEPIVPVIKLKLIEGGGAEVPARLHPNLGTVQIAIKRPGGDVIRYQPMVDHCATPETVTLHTESAVNFDSAFIGYGSDGFYFDQPGRYQLRAVCQGADGSRIVSKAVSFLVRSPTNAEEDELGELFLGEQQGKLLYLLGSDSEFLAEGNAAFDLVLEKYPKHPMAAYAGLVQGFNAARSFKTVTAEKKLEVRDAELDRSDKLLSKVVDMSEEQPRLDEVTLGMTMRRLQGVQKAAGRMDAFDATEKRIDAHYGDKSSPPSLIECIDRQVGEFADTPELEPLEPEEKKSTKRTTSRAKLSGKDRLV